jgi:iron(III) transport system substrate-binding protein
MFVLGYNRNMISKDQLPKTWAELAAPRWKGQIGAEADDSAWFATLLEDLGREPGLKVFREIVEKSTVSIRKGHSLLGKLVAAGEVPLAINLYSWNVDQLKETGAPIERFDIGVPVAQFQGIGIAKRAPNPASAALFVDFILTEGQAIISKQHAIATSNRFDAAQKSRPIAFIDPVVAMDRYEARQKEYQDLFIKKR